ncbi:hypothetical protein [Nonomuraea sp. NPDC005501]|uniref:hypothetical protein n=1 Tax=Nonomuraea sp. NPDC005501 TaxID=3156884 RepID=UPI0033ABBA3A
MSSSEVDEGRLVYESAFEVGAAVTSDGGKLMKRGHASSEIWNAAVTGPSFLRSAGHRRS